MARYPKPSDARSQLVADLDSVQVAVVARRPEQACLDVHQLAAHRIALGLTRATVAKRMGVTKRLVSQIERGERVCADVAARYVEAIGGQLEIDAVFGDERCALRGAGTDDRLPAGRHRAADVLRGTGTDGS